MNAINPIKDQMKKKDKTMTSFDAEGLIVEFLQGVLIVSGDKAYILDV
jgi:hypothetical protein